MNTLLKNRYAALSLLSITLTATISAIHHLYRDGLGLLAAWALLIVLPYLLLRWFDQSQKRLPLWLYGLYNLLIITQFGVVDGFLDHTLKALGFQHLTLLPGGDADVVQTVFALWSPQAGHLFYEGTGVLTFVGSVFATVYLFQVIRTLGHPRQQRIKEQLTVSSEIRG